MAKTYLGVDFGYDSLKLALCKDGRVKKSVLVPMPDNMLRGGRIASPESMGELIRSAMREHRIRASLAAAVLSGETTYLRTTSMPRMTADQLAYNIPYEFNDYITDELKNYVFDYAMISAPEDGGDSMELMTAAVPSAVLDELRETLRKAGLKLAKAAPAECAYIALIRAHEKKASHETLPEEYCVLDLGYRAIRMYMFRGDRHMTTRVLEIGLSTLDEVVADAKGVDVHLAHTHLIMNYEDCQNQEYCRNAFNNIAVELMRSLNFYRFSNPDSRLSGVWLCGGGAVLEPLREAIEGALDVSLHRMDELIDGGENCHAFAQAIGLTLD